MDKLEYKVGDIATFVVEIQNLSNLSVGFMARDSCDRRPVIKVPEKRGDELLVICATYLNSYSFGPKETDTIMREIEITPEMKNKNLRFSATFEDIHLELITEKVTVDYDKQKENCSDVKCPNELYYQQNELELPFK